MPTHRSRTGTSPCSARRKGQAKQSRNAKSVNAVGAKSGAKGGKKSVGKAARGKSASAPLRAQPPLSADPRVMEAAYRAFERMPRPRYLH